MELFLPYAPMGEPFAGRVFCEDEVDEIPLSECLALVEHYYFNDGPNWISSRWMTNDRPCSWEGVTCTKGHVTGLIVSGYISAALENLPELQSLRFEHPIGHIPPQLGNLNQLRTLVFLFGELQGTIPAELGNLGNLEELQFIYSRTLVGTIPPELGNLSNLKILNISVTQLDGPIPSELGNLANLAGLYIIYSRVSGPIPPEIGQLTNLYALEIRGNRLSGTLPTTLVNLSNLVHYWVEEDGVCIPDDPELHAWLEENEFTSYTDRPCPVE